MSETMSPEQTIADQLQDLGALHEEMADASSSVSHHVEELLSLSEEPTDAEMQELEDELREMVDDHEAAVGYHRDAATFFYGMADIFRAGDWQYSDLRMVHEMMDA